MVRVYSAFKGLTEVIESQSVVVLLASLIT